MKLLIKNMVSIRCRMIVKSVMEDMGLHYTAVELGEVEIIGELTTEEQRRLKENLQKFGLELMEDKKAYLLNKLKISLRK